MRKIIFLFLISIFLIGACTQSNPDSDMIGKGSTISENTNKQSTQTGASADIKKSEKPSQTVTNQTTVTQTAPISNVKEFKITAKSWEFDPATIQVNKGDKVKLIITSVDVPHGFSIPEYEINERIDPGKPVSVEFTADKQGTFTSFCSVFCGSGHSKMKGSFVVK